MRRLIIIVVFFAIHLVYGQKEVMIDFSESIVNWDGADLLGLNRHHGTVRFKTGTLKREGAVVTGGVFEIDMTSIVNTDGEYSERLVSHLKNVDFFDVKKHSITKLEIMYVQYLNAIDVDVMAYLTINSIRKTIKYPAVIENVNDEIVMKSKFTIDRTLWKINYKSNSVFKEIIQNVISDDIEFEVLVVTNSDGC